MKKYLFTILAIILAVVFWYFESSVHYLVYGEPEFEILPQDFDELWMRTTIVALIMLFGVYADYSSARLVDKEKQVEALKIYNSMMMATHHILNNLVNQLQLFKIEAMRCGDFDADILKHYDVVIHEAGDLIKKLSHIEHVTGANIWASVDPKIIKASSKSANPVDT